MVHLSQGDEELAEQIFEKVPQCQRSSSLSATFRWLKDGRNASRRTRSLLVIH